MNKGVHLHLYPQCPVPLEKEGYIVSPARSWYNVTAEGLAYIKAINSKPARYQEQWDHTWDVVMLEVPESERKKRDLFRTALGQLGYGLLYNSVYISPWNYQDEVAAQIQKLELDGKVSILQGQFQEGMITPLKAQAIWHLNDIEALYRKKAVWLKGRIRSAISGYPSGGATVTAVPAIFANGRGVKRTVHG